MIVTAFVTDATAAAQRDAEVIEYAWQRAGQTGELVRLLAGGPETSLPLHALCRVEGTLSWTRHPYIEDIYPGYELPAALLQWLSRESLDATILLLDSNCIQREGIDREVEPGQALAQSWSDFPVGDGPFGLPSPYAALSAFCVNRELTLTPVRLPLLIHSRDLRKLAARWLELTAIIRHDVRDGEEALPDAADIALAIAAAEYRVEMCAQDFRGVIVRADEAPEKFLAYYRELDVSHESGERLSHLRPRRQLGVREGRVLDQVYVESGWPLRMVTLNSSAAAIWQLCDGIRTLRGISEELQATHGIPMETMMSDVKQAVLGLQQQGAITLEAIN